MNNFTANDAITLIHPSQKLLEGIPTNSLLNSDYRFKENFLKYTCKPEEIKNSFYLRFCFLLDFFSIELKDIIEIIVNQYYDKKHREPDTEEPDAVELFNAFKYNKKDFHCSKYTPSYIDAFIKCMQSIKYSKSHLNPVLSYSRERILISYEQKKFVCENYDYFRTFLIEVISFIENNVTHKKNHLHFLQKHYVLTPYTLRIWTDTYFSTIEINNSEYLSNLPNKISKHELLNFSTDTDFNDWAYILSNWEFYNKISSDSLLVRNFTTILQMNEKEISNQIVRFRESKYTLSSPQLVSDIEKNAFLLIPLKKRRKGNKRKSEELFEKINKKCLQSQDNYICFLICNLYIKSIVKLKSKHYLLLYYCTCFHVIL